MQFTKTSGKPNFWSAVAFMSVCLSRLSASAADANKGNTIPPGKTVTEPRRRGAETERRDVVNA